MGTFFDNLKERAEERHTVVGRRNVKTAIVEVNHPELVYCSGNPRYVNEIKLRRATNALTGRLTQEKFAAQLLVEDKDFLPFVATIRAHGAIIMPLQVAYNGELNDGHRRLGAARYAYNTLKDARFKYILVEVYGQDMTNEDFDALIAYLHNGAGQKDHQSIDRARQMNTLQKRGMNEGEIATFLGGDWNKGKVREYLEAYKWMSHYQESTNDYRPQIFTAVMKFGKHSRVQKLVAADPKWMNFFFKLVQEDKINDCRNVDKLDKVIGNPKAVKLAEKSGLKAALCFLAEQKNKNADKTHDRLAKACDTVTKDLVGLDLTGIVALREGKDLIQVGRRLKMEAAYLELRKFFEAQMEQAAA